MQLFLGLLNRFVVKQPSQFRKASKWRFWESIPYAITVKDNQVLSIDDEVTEHVLSSGRVAMAKHLGSHDSIEQTVYAVYQHWLPSTKEELADHPCVFCYQNYVTDVPESALETDIYFFLKG